MREHEELAADLDECADSCVLAEKHNWAQHMRRAAALLREARPQPVPAADGEPVAWLWEYIGSEIDPHRRGPVARSLHEMDPSNPPYPKTWKPISPLYDFRHHVPVPMTERPWERPGWCDSEGRCWWGRCADDFFNPEWTMATLANIEEFCSDAMPQHCLPHWAIPQPPQANTTHPTPTKPPTDD